MIIHFRRKAGTLHELSYAPCGASSPIAFFSTPEERATSTIDPKAVTCAVCAEWLQKRSKHESR